MTNRIIGAEKPAPPAPFDEIIHCGQCAAFRRTTDGKPEGACHRHPPMVVVMPMAVQSQHRPPEYKAASAHPPTLETGGCLDFVPDEASMRTLNERAENLRKVPPEL